jgi:flagellar biosynthetic protein FliR
MMLKPKMFMTIFQSGSLIFSMALLISLPIVVAMLLINIVTGVVTRVAPQLNIFSVGFPITILAGLVLMMVLIPSIAHSIAAYVNDIGLKMRDFLLISQEG